MRENIGKYEIVYKHFSAQKNSWDLLSFTAIVIIQVIKADFHHA